MLRHKKLTERGIIYLGTKCNLKCRHCYFDEFKDTRKWREMYWVIFRILVIKLCGLKKIDFTGGEPTMHPYITKLVWICDILGFKEIRLVTNGTMARVVREMLIHENLRLSVSVHSHISGDLAEIGKNKDYPEKLFSFLREFSEIINYVNMVPTALSTDFEFTPSAIHQIVPKAVLCIKMLDYNFKNDIPVKPDYKIINNAARRLLNSSQSVRLDFRCFPHCFIDEDIHDNDRVDVCTVLSNVYDEMDWTPVIAWLTPWWVYLVYIFGTKRMRECVSNRQARVTSRSRYDYSKKCECCIYKNKVCDGIAKGYLKTFGDGEVEAKI
jgi:organic radical activating enzyme